MRFIYIARDPSGKRVSAVEDAETADELLNRLQLRGLIVTNIKIQTEVSRPFQVIPGRRHKFAHNKIKGDDLNIFARQLATVLDSGVPLIKSLASISALIPSRRLHEVLNKIIYEVESGLSLRDALAKYPKVFSPLWVNLVETGEASGSLPTILDRLATYLELRSNFRKKITSAMIYPIILLVVAICAIFIFIIVVVPKFTEIFTNFDIVLPLPTQILIALSKSLKANLILIFFGLVGIILAFRKYSHSYAGKLVLDRFLLKVPLISEYVLLSETEKFASTMATLLESGVPILYALEISESSSGNVKVQSVIKNVKNNVREGKSLAVPLEESGFFPPMVTQMISMGEEIGELDKMFKKIAYYYAESLETKITRFSSMFEPMMIVFMGVTIGSMVISMFMPIFKLATFGGK